MKITESVGNAATASPITYEPEENPQRDLWTRYKWKSRSEGEQREGEVEEVGREEQ